MTAVCPTPGKQMYFSRRHAKAARRDLSKRSSAAGMVAYLCERGYWHIGHRRGFRMRDIAPPVECAKRFRDSGYTCPRPGVHQLETSAGFAWLCDDHWFELNARLAQIRREAA